MTADDTPIPEANANAAQEASSDPSIQSNDDDGDGDGDVEMEAIKAQEDDCDSPARTPPPDISNSNKRRKSDNDNDDDDGGENNDSDSDSDNHNSAKDPKTAAMEQALHVQEVVDPLKEIPVVLKSVDTLRTAISEVIAFPTQLSYSRLLTHAKTAHDSFHTLGKVVELGETNAANEKNTTQIQSPIVLDSASRSKFNASGTNIWNMIQKHPQLFADTVHVVSTQDMDRSSDEDAQAAQEKMEKDRGAASGYIRSLACRLILLSKVRTRGLSVPELVMAEERTDTDTDATSLLGGNSHSLPCALSSELEFGLKCFTRAGRAILLHSNNDYESALCTLSFAIVCWDGIQQSNVDFDCAWSGRGQNRIGGDHARADAFDALMLLPDCASKLVPKDEMYANVDLNVNVDADLNVDKDDYSPSSRNIILQLQRLEEFVNDQFTIPGGDKSAGLSSSLFAIQHYLPSLARIGYKHGNRFARLQDYTASQEALRISLTATDKCISKIRQEKNYAQKDGEVAGHSSQVHEQEMLVVSKQSFHVLSHVCRSVDKFEEASKCLDRIELYINEQRSRDDELYSQTMVQLSARDRGSTAFHQGSSTFALEGPQMQDLEEIKVRAQSARARAREVESTERVNLAFSRIDLRQKAFGTLSDDDEKFVDFQFNIMVECAKKHSATSTRTSKNFAMHKTIFTAARLISTRRLLTLKEEQGKHMNPYSVFAIIFSDRDVQQVHVHLEDLHTAIMAAKSARDSTTCNVAKIQALDQRGIEIGKHLISQLRIISIPVSTSSLLKHTESTLFGGQVKHNDMKPLLEKARAFCTKGVSLYQGQEHCADQTLEWSDILLNVLEISRESKLPGGSDVSEIQYDKVVAGVMAIRAFTQSNCGSYGIALKTARAAWEKDGTELGNLITLFHCALQYESFSNSNTDSIDGCTEPDMHAYPNTLLELDGALNVYESLSKLEKSNDINYLQKLLEAFPLLCKIGLEKKVLLLGLQRRMIEISIKVTTNMVSNEVSEVPNERHHVSSLFGVLRAYLVIFEELLEKFFFTKEKQWQLDQLVGLQSMLGSTLDLLLLVRDGSIKEKHNGGDILLFHDSHSYLEENAHPTQSSNTAYQSLFDLSPAKELIGTQNECLWIAEQLWNISNQMMAVPTCSDIKKDYSRFFAEYLKDAHDFALLSEEEAHVLLTKGHLGRERFNGELYASTSIDFSSRRLKATDLCSEFSAQCLLSSVANIIDHISSEGFVEISAEKSQLLKFTLKCLIVAKAELATLELESDRAEKATLFLSLNLLVAIRDDEYCFTALNDGGILKNLKVDILASNGDSSNGPSGMSPLDHLYILANRAHLFDMQLTAKELFCICADEMIRTQKVFIINQSNTIGLIQRIIINLASTVEEVVTTFDSINRLMEKNNQSNDDEKLLTYSMEDMDYLVVEAHNRACSLTFIGDTKNAEKLLTVALNLLPHCSKEVESYGSEIRRAYRGVIGRQEPASLSTGGDLISLLKD